MMNYIIIEDEQFGARMLAEAIGRLRPSYRLLCILGTVRESVDYFRRHPDDDSLVFMDVELSDGQCFEIFNQCRVGNPIIFTTSHDEWAIRAFRVNSIDYLLKPISFDRFLKAVNRVHELLQKEQESTPEPYLFVKTDKLLKKVTIQDILFIESMGNYVLIHTSSSKEITYSPLKSLLEFLPDNLFMQVHRSYIVQTSKIQAIEGNMLIIGIHKIPIARSLRDEVLNALLKDKLISR